jgi:hypothetical protein
MKVYSSRIFEYSRVSSLDRLVQQSQNKHYSTFALYDKELFLKSLEIFKQNIKNNFEDLNQVKWVDENILLEIRKW